MDRPTCSVRTIHVLMLALALLSLTAATGCIRNLGRQPAWGQPTTLEFELDRNVQAPPQVAMVFFCGETAGWCSDSPFLSRLFWFSPFFPVSWF